MIIYYNLSIWNCNFDSINQKNWKKRSVYIKGVCKDLFDNKYFILLYLSSFETPVSYYYNLVLQSVTYDTNTLLVWYCMELSNNITVYLYGVCYWKIKLKDYNWFGAV